jgi:hypothetical protein
MANMESTSGLVSSLLKMGASSTVANKEERMALLIRNHIRGATLDEKVCSALDLVVCLKSSEAAPHLTETLEEAVYRPYFRSRNDDGDDDNAPRLPASPAAAAPSPAAGVPPRTSPQEMPPPAAWMPRSIMMMRPGGGALHHGQIGPEWNYPYGGHQFFAPPLLPPAFLAMQAQQNQMAGLCPPQCCWEQH